MRQKAAARPAFSVKVRPDEEPARESEIPVLAIGEARVNLIVVTRIAARAGLRSSTVRPGEAAAQIGRLRPRVLVLDGGTDDKACDGLAETITEARRISASSPPRIVFLSGHPQTAPGSALAPLVDAVLAKPFTPDQLQPILVEFCRD